MDTIPIEKTIEQKVFAYYAEDEALAEYLRDKNGRRNLGLSRGEAAVLIREQVEQDVDEQIGNTSAFVSDCMQMVFDYADWTRIAERLCDAYEIVLTDMSSKLKGEENGR